MASMAQQSISGFQEEGNSAPLARVGQWPSRLTIQNVVCGKGNPDSNLNADLNRAVNFPVRPPDDKPVLTLGEPWLGPPDFAISQFA